MNGFKTRLKQFVKDGGIIKNGMGRITFSYGEGDPIAIIKVRMDDGDTTYFYRDEKIGTDDKEAKDTVLKGLSY